MPILGPRGGGADLSLDPLDGDVIGLQVAIFLVAEVVVEGLPVEAAAVEHGPHGGVLVAVGANRFEHAAEDPLPFGWVQKWSPVAPPPSVAEFDQEICLFGSGYFIGIPPIPS